MKVFLLIVMACAANNPGLQCQRIGVENHPGRVAESRQECIEKSREHVHNFFSRNKDLVYRGHDCKQITTGTGL